MAPLITSNQPRDAKKKKKKQPNSKSEPVNGSSIFSPCKFPSHFRAKARHMQKNILNPPTNKNIPYTLPQITSLKRRKSTDIISRKKQR